MAESLSVHLPYVEGRPEVTAQLKSDTGESRFFEFLVDSGADMCTISKSHAAQIGINYEHLDTKEENIEMVNFQSVHGKKSMATLSFRGFEKEIPILICKEAASPLLGRKGSFEMFDILFEERKMQITLKP